MADLVGVGRNTGKSHREHLKSQGFPKVPIILPSSQGPQPGERARSSTVASNPCAIPRWKQRGDSQTRLSSRNCGSRGAGHTQTPWAAPSPTEGPDSSQEDKGSLWRNRNGFQGQKRERGLCSRKQEQLLKGKGGKSRGREKRPGHLRGHMGRPPVYPAHTGQPP